MFESILLRANKWALASLKCYLETIYLQIIYTQYIYKEDCGIK